MVQVAFQVMKEIDDRYKDIEYEKDRLVHRLLIGVVAVAAVRAAIDLVHDGSVLGQLAALAHMPLLVAELALPAGHNRAGHHVAENVNGRAGHVHEGINSQDQRQGLKRDVGVAEGSDQDNEGSTGHGGNTLGGQHQGKHHNDLLTDGLVHTSNLGTEHGGQGEVEGGTVQVEGVTSGDDKGDDLWRAAESDHVLHGLGEGRLGGGSGKGHQEGTTDGAGKVLERETGQNGNREQDDDGKYDQGSIESADQLADRAQGTKTILSDSGSESGTDTDGSVVHDQDNNLEHDLGERVVEGEHDLLGLIVSEHNGDGEHDSAEDKGEDGLGVSQGGKERNWHNVVQLGDPRDGGAGDVGVCGARHGETDSGLDNVDGKKTNDQGEGGDDLKVHDRLDCQTSNTCQVVTVSCNTDNQSRENERSLGTENSKKEIDRLVFWP